MKKFLWLGFLPAGLGFIKVHFGHICLHFHYGYLIFTRFRGFLLLCFLDCFPYWEFIYYVAFYFQKELVLLHLYFMQRLPLWFFIRGFRITQVLFHFLLFHLYFRCIKSYKIKFVIFLLRCF